MTDSKRVYASIALEPERSAILAALLGTFGPGDGAWAWRAGGATNISFVVHLAHAPGTPLVIGYGPPAGIENLLAAALPELPAHVALHFPTAHREAFARAFTMDVAPHTVFSLVREDLVEPTRRARTGGPGGRDGAEAAPVVSREFRRAFVGRIAPGPAGARGPRDAARHVTLARRLFDEGIEVIGAVEPDEDAAGRSLLASIGYVARGHVLIGAGTLRGARVATGAPRALDFQVPDS